MRRNRDKAADFAERHGVPKWYDSAEQLIGDSEINAIYIATPPGSHAEYAIRSAEAGKAVYVEKPMAARYQACRAIISACEKARSPLFVAYYRRRLPAFLKIKEWVDSNAIGEIRGVTIRLFQPLKPGEISGQNLNWRVKPEISGGGHFFDLASHQFDFLDYLLGPIRSAKGAVTNQAGKYDAEDLVSASFEFKSGVLGAGLWSFAAQSNRRLDETEIVGSRGRIIFPTFNPEPVILETENDKEIFEQQNPPHVQQPLIQTIVDELRGFGKCPSTGESAARTNWVLEQIIKEWKKRGNLDV